MLRSQWTLTSSFMLRIVFLFPLLCGSSLVFGSALPAGKNGALARRDVWAPPITYPTKETVWTVGDTVEVTWSTDNPPEQITNPNGILALRTTNGFLLGPGGLGEPLAGNFSLFDGQVSVQVPDVPSRDDYQVVLIGDSGNDSPYFTITNAFLDPFLTPF